MQIQCSECFKNLGVESRTRIYQFIRSRENPNVSEITAFIGLRQPTVSYHLSEMVNSGLLSKVKRGRESVYSINANCPHRKGRCVVSE